MLDEIRDYQRKIFAKHNFSYKRYFNHSINLEPRFTGIVGARGVGKTTFLIQYLKELELPFSQKLYISADTINIPSLYEVAEVFAKENGKTLVIDEIHKYKNYERELKKIYDILDMKVIFSGSSALQIDHSKADLSRRVIVHHLEGLSFREFIELKDNITLPVFNLEDILLNHIDIAYELLDKFNLRLSFKEYLQNGYYPFYFEDKQSYLLRLNETINTAIEVDIPSIFPIEYASVVNLKRLVRLICESLPYKPNLQELLVKMGMKDDYKRFYRFLDYLDKAKVLSPLRSSAKGDAIFVKPEKIYLNNTNLHYAYCRDIEIGTVRETFFASMLNTSHEISILKKGDFLIDDKYTFEVGGKNKKFKQIENLPNSFVASDEIEVSSRNKIPLWLFGFLY